MIWKIYLLITNNFTMVLFISNNIYLLLKTTLTIMLKTIKKIKSFK